MKLGIAIVPLDAIQSSYPLIHYHKSTNMAVGATLAPFSNVDCPEILCGKGEVVPVL
jgi:hypothetical protein